jgi:hypothetical protein
MAYPIPRTKTQTPTVSTDQEIVNQGSVPLAQTTSVGIPAAPKGRQKPRGFGAMMRPQSYLVR